MRDSTKHWIALERVSGVGPVQLKEIYGKISTSGVSLSEVFELTETEMKKDFSLSEKSISSIQYAVGLLGKISDEYQQLIDSNIDVTLFFNDSYPARLNDIMGNSIPPILYSSGNRSILKNRGAAILGERNISSRGEFIAYMAAKDLVYHDITVISGLANGAGLTAHRSALEYGGKTIALLPYGIMKLNIPEMLKPYFDSERFIAVSVFPPDDSADRFKAYERNRIICALSYAVFIVESPETGGIFETAKSAHNLKIPLYTAEYSEYPESASGNKKILAAYGAYPVRGKRTSDGLTVPNIDRIISDVKFR